MDRATTRILVIDDEPDVRSAIGLTITLQEPGWEVLTAPSGEEGLGLLETAHPDAVLLDLQMPDADGYEVLRQIRLFSDVPVVILTVRNDELDKVRGLQLGADDYVVKPFGHLELLARIRSVLRRASGHVAADDPAFALGDLRIDWAAHRVAVRGREVRLTSTEFRLLELLARNAGRVVENDVLLARVWGPDSGGDTDYLKVYVHRLRAKLETDPASPRYLRTERGVGYWMPRSVPGEDGSSSPGGAPA